MSETAKINNRENQDLTKLLQLVRQQLSLNTINETDLIELCSEFCRLSIDFEHALSKHVTNGTAFSVHLRKGLQNRQFMIDLLPRIQSWLHKLPIDTKLSVLDVGPSWALGTNLLAGLYKRPYLGYTLDVTAIDIRNTYVPYVKAFCPYIKYLTQDFFQFDKTFDIVICSHVIEHVENPEVFVKRLVKTAKKRVFLAAPYMEKEPRATNHINMFDDEFLGALNADKIEIVQSPAWGARSNKQKRMFIAQLPGRASK